MFQGLPYCPDVAKSTRAPEWPEKDLPFTHVTSSFNGKCQSRGKLKSEVGPSDLFRQELHSQPFWKTVSSLPTVVNENNLLVKGPKLETSWYIYFCVSRILI